MSFALYLIGKLPSNPPPLETRLIDRPRGPSYNAAVETIDVTAAVIRRDGAVLIAQRPPGSHMEGLWEFPGGKRDVDETLEDCLARECAEELDVTVRVGPLLRVIEHTYPDRRIKLYFFECTLAGGEPSAVGCQAVRWVAPGDLAGFSFPAADAQLVEELASGLL